MSAHTPGDWKPESFDQDGVPGAIRADGVAVAAPTFAGHSPETIIANARLMAASPKLLALLKETDQALRDAWYRGELPHSVIPASLAQRTRAIIAQVEGVTP